MGKEEIVLDLNVDQGSMIAELERTKSVIIGLKKEQQDLNKAYKAGEITQEEYAKELVRVEALLKTSNATYTNTQKAVTGVKTKMDDLIASNNKLASSVKQSTENIRVGGVTVGELGTKLTALANPVTAAVGVVTALGVAYARSSIGAKDLEFASNQLSIGIDILTDRLARNVSSVEDGEGAVTKLFNSYLKFNENMPTGRFLKFLGIDLKEVREQSFNAAQAMEALQQAQRDAVLGQSVINERNAETADLMAIVGNAEAKINERREAGAKIQENIKQNAKELTAFKNREILAELELLNVRKESGGNTEDIEFRINKLVAERSAIETNQERQNTKIEKQLNSINNAESKRLDTMRKQSEETAKKIKLQEEIDKKLFDKGDISFDDDPSSPIKEFDPQEQFEKDKELIDETLGLTISAEDQKRAELLKTNALKDSLAEEDRRRFEESAQLMEDNFNTLAGLFSQGSEARKLFALAGIGADTASAIASLTAMSEANPANAVTFGGAGVAQYAAGIIRILANIVAAKEFLGGSFAGGADFVTSKPTMIMVGDNPGNRERVTVQPLSGKGRSSYNPRSGLASFAGGGSMTFDGQSTNATRTINETLAASNALKNMPIPEVSVKEITKVQRKIKVKENISRA